MKWYNYIYAIIVTICLTGCYEDKGNYNYKEVNKITFMGFNSNNNATGGFYSCSFKDTLKLVANFKFEKENETDLSYKWYSDDVLISTDDTLFFPAAKLTFKYNRPGSTYGVMTNRSYIKLVITSNKTGQMNLGGINVDVDPLYLTGYIVLSQKADKSCYMHYIRNIWNSDGTLSNEVVSNIYEQENAGETLGNDVVCIRVCDSQNSGAVMHTLAVKSNAPYTVDLTGSFKKEVATAKYFIGGQIPVGYSPIDEWSLRNCTYILDKSGVIYSRRKNNGMDFQSGSYSNVPAYLADGMKVTRMLHTHMNMMYLAFYDALHQRILIATDYGQIVPLLKPSAGLPAGFPDPSNLQGEILYGGRNSYSGARTNYMTMVYKSNQGEYKILQMCISSISASWTTNPSVPINTTTAPPKVYTPTGIEFHPNSQFAQPNRSTDIFLASGGTENKTLYLYNFLTGAAVVYATFESPITTIVGDDRYRNLPPIIRDNATVAVGLESGVVKIVDIRPEARIDSNYDKRILKSVDFNHGKIIQIMEKAGISNYAQ